MPVIEVQRSSLEGVLLELSPAVEHMPADRLSAEEATRALGLLQARKARDDAREAELLMSLAADRPDTDDPPPGHPGARRRSQGSPVPGTSEFLPDEAAMVLNCGRPHATDLLSDAYQLVERMPAVHAERRAGRLDGYRARIFADVLGTASDEVIAVVVPEILPAAAGWSSGKLRKRLIAAAVAADEEFAERRRQEAERRAAVRLYPTADGMSALTTEAPAAVAAAMWSVIDQAAQLAKTAGDDRPIGVLRAEAHAARVLGMGDDSRPAMSGHVTITAPLYALRPSRPTTETATTPMVAGTPITSAHLRELLAQLNALGVQAPAGGSLALALTDDDGALLATVTPAELARLAARGCTHHGREADCDCPVLGPPPEVPGYSHTAAQERFLRLRDRTCRHPGCGQPAGRTDADHVVPYACGGRTSCDNLCCLCRSHHRSKTFARGWRFQMDPDGTLHVTTPSGITRSTRPPGLHDQRALPPPRHSPVDDDPPPF
ncbi:protein of unknown function [Blastococcus fimeti]|nr:protein of unknown function [Blastococcus fimeti]